MIETIAALSGGLFSFLGGTVFRLVFGEVMSYLNKKVDQAHELLLLDRQTEADAARATWQREGLKLQAELGIKVIEAKAEARADEQDGEAFLFGVKATMIQTGIRFIDGWNQAIRPGVATWAVAMLTLEAFKLVASLDEGTREVVSAALGLFLADRSLARRGK